MAYLPRSQEQTTMHVLVHGVQKEVRLVYKPDGSALEDANAIGYIYEVSDRQRLTLRFVAQDTQAENIPPLTQPPTPACASVGFDGVGPQAFPAASASADEATEKWSTRKTKFLISKYTEIKDLVGKSREFRTTKLLWVRLSKLINKNFMCNMTTTQIENKWKSLDRAYQMTKKDISSSGHLVIWSLLRDLRI
ncbi:uncharacterized protein LOC144133760 [Amblyomma americanum]